MPEGVEVKLSADLIKPLLVNEFVATVEFPKTSRYHINPPEGFNAWNQAEKESHKIKDIATKGKFMYWTFENDWYMFSTFGMTGQWSPAPGKHVCAGMTLVEYRDDPGVSSMYFNDPRHFGTLKFVQGKANLMDKLGELGWDPLQRSLEEYDKFIHGQIHVAKKPIGDVLMDQGVFAGVGNYIRAEALYLAKISPWRPCHTLVADEINRIQQALVDVMKDSYKHQGATILTYKDAYGAEGKYASCFKVYGQKKDPLGNEIKKETMPDGRTIHWSPAVQM